MTNITKQLNELSTFDDIENELLRKRNRGVVMANIFEDNLVTGSKDKISTIGTKLLLSYMSKIPLEERKSTFLSFKEQMQLRGFVGGVH
jgi:hypothetical protein